MMYYYSMIYILAAVARAQTSSSEPLACCHGGGVAMLMLEDYTPLCWEPRTNTTEPVALACDLTAVLNDTQYEVESSGWLYVYTNDLLTIEASTDEYCIGNLTTFDDVNLTQTREKPALCYELEQERIIDQEILAWCMVVSVVFFAVTALVYAVLTELRDLQGKSIINFCVCFSISLMILAITNLTEYSNMDLCAARGMFLYFFLIGGFFWMNAIAIQLFLSLRRPSLTSAYGWHEFKWWAVYAWGAPALLTVVMAIVNFTPGRHHKSGIGLNHCWFINKKQQWWYFYSVISIISIINICIFIYSSVILWRHSFGSTNIRALKYKFTMTLRLFILMGLPWIFEIISSESPSHILLEVIDIFNVLQGALIFIVLVVLRKRTLKALQRRDALLCLGPCVERYLATADDEEDVIMHTDIPMSQERDTFN